MNEHIFDNIAEIDKIKFNVFSNEEIKKYSVINNKEDIYGINSYEIDDNGQPKKGGINDARLGIIDLSQECSTCGLNSIECPGHIGHTELANYVYHYGYLTHLKSILSCICLRCSKLLIYKTDEEIEDFVKTKSKKVRFALIKKACTNIASCLRPDGCGAVKPKIKTDIKKAYATIHIVAETIVKKEDEANIKSKTIKQIITPEHCYNILKNISDVDCMIMGIQNNRPESLIIKNFVIPPLAIRPSIRGDFMAVASIENGLTHKLVDIIKANLRIRKQKEKELKTNELYKFADDNHNLLQYHVATYYDNDSLSLPKSEQKSGGKIFQSIVERLKSKGGRIKLHA